ncbi:hypothetical protein B0H14DRAFT_3444611 [Mycena olivaceomarginata]|nr:hypothetical protein B0H14DRAFT_3444611 [Mycena olivaceomarginata]
MILAGEIRWVSMSKEARAALIKEQDRQRAESGGTLLKRKERSDKGAIRGPRVKETNKTPRDAIPTLAAVGAGSGLPVPIPSLSHSPLVLDDNVSRIPSTTNAPPVPSTAAATTAASDTAPTSSPDLGLTDLLQMSNDGLVPDLDFDLDFLNISNNMAAAFPEMMGMQALTPGYYGNTPGPSSAVYAPDLGLPALPRPTPPPPPHQVGLDYAGRQHGLEAHCSSPGGCKHRGTSEEATQEALRHRYPTQPPQVGLPASACRLPYALRFTAPTCLHPWYHIY